MTKQEKIELTRLVGSLNHQRVHAQQVSEYVRKKHPEDMILLDTLLVQSKEMVASHNELNNLSGNVPNVDSRKCPWDDDHVSEKKRPWDED